MGKCKKSYSLFAMLVLSLLCFDSYSENNLITLYYSPITIKELSVRKVTSSDVPYYSISPKSQIKFESLMASDFSKSGKLIVNAIFSDDMDKLIAAPEVAKGFYRFVHTPGDNQLSGAYSFPPTVFQVQENDIEKAAKGVQIQLKKGGEVINPTFALQTDLRLANGVEIPNVNFANFSGNWVVAALESTDFDSESKHKQASKNHCLWLKGTDSHPYTLCNVGKSTFYLSLGHTGGTKNTHKVPHSVDSDKKNYDQEIFINHPDVNSVDMIPVTFGEVDEYDINNDKATFWSAIGEDKQDDALSVKLKVASNDDKEKIKNGTHPYSYFTDKLRNYPIHGYAPAYPVKPYNISNQPKDEAAYSFLSRLVINNYATKGIIHFISDADNKAAFEIDSHSADHNSSDNAKKQGCLEIETDAPFNNHYTVCGANKKGNEFYLSNGWSGGKSNDHSYPGNNRTHSLDMYVCVNQTVSHAKEQQYTISLLGLSCMYVNNQAYSLHGNSDYSTEWEETASQLQIPAASPAGLYCTKHKVFSLGAKNSASCFTRAAKATIVLNDENNRAHTFNVHTGWHVGLAAGQNHANLRDGSTIARSGFILGAEGGAPDSWLSKVEWRGERQSTLVLKVDD